MALVTAVFGSLLGIVAGIVGAAFFGASVFESFAIYLGVALTTITLISLSMVLRPDKSSDETRKAEDLLDADWERFADLQARRRMTGREKAFAEDLDTPLAVDDAAEEENRVRDRRGGDRRRGDRRTG